MMRRIASCELSMLIYDWRATDSFGQTFFPEPKLTGRQTTRKEKGEKNMASTQEEEVGKNENTYAGMEIHQTSDVDSNF